MLPTTRPAVDRRGYPMDPGEEGNRIIALVKKYPTIVLPIAALLLFVVIYTPAFLHSSSTSGTDKPSDNANLLPVDVFPHRTFHSRADVPEGESFPIAAITDLDKRSRVTIKGKSRWVAFYRLGYLTRKTDGSYAITWIEERMLDSGLNEAGRGMELSELVMWNGQMFSFDDRSGIVYEIINPTLSDDHEKTAAVARFILPDGNMRSTKGMKIEWATVVDDSLLVGSIGKEWTSPTGVMLNNNPQWVKSISKDYKITPIDWSNNYNTLRERTGTSKPGYLLHEAIYFKRDTRTWVIAPRRLSAEAYDEIRDNEMGTNVILTANEDFSQINTITVGPTQTLRGVSSIKEIPGHPNEFVMLRTEEDMETEAQKSFITVISLEGNILMEDQFIGDFKYEGVEFPIV